MTTFQKALNAHISAIQRRDLPALAATVKDDEITLITSDGRLVRSAREMLDMHRGWFEMPGWALDVTPVDIQEGADMAMAVLRLVYREPRPQGPPSQQESYLTLVFRLEHGQWRMTHDQNTPIRATPSQIDRSDVDGPGRPAVG